MSQLITTGVRTACRGAIENGVTRCRRMVDGYGLCPNHYHKPLAAKPGLVLLKMRINRKKVEKLVDEEGVLVKRRDEAALDQRHAAEAEQHRRSATVYREVADSGVPVFGKEGAQHVRIGGVWNEIIMAGYRVTGYHVYQNDKDFQNGMGTMVVEFKLEGEEVFVGSFVQELFDDETYGFVHVWVNPPKPNVGVTHTINISHKEVATKAIGSLIWDNGHWALESI